MSPLAVLAVQCVLILLASLVGGWVPMLVRLTHGRVQLAVSFVAGVMLGVGVLHLLPHAAEFSPSLDRVVLFVLIGFLAMFFVERFFAFHHHDAPEVDEASHAEHDHAEPSSVHVHQKRPHELSWSGAAIGLSLHSIMNGVALAASVQATWSAGQPYMAGIGTFLVIFLHKPFDALTLGTLMAVGGYGQLARHLVNGLFSLAIPVGAAIFLLGAGLGSGDTEELVGAALAFSAGMFICIASSDLLPELQFHQHDRVKLSVALLLGIGLAWAIGLFEPHEHGHGGLHHRHEPGAANAHDGHEHDGHAH